jgi:hypothetical protein
MMQRTSTWTVLRNFATMAHQLVLDAADDIVVGLEAAAYQLASFIVGSNKRRRDDDAAPELQRPRLQN